ncbi:hypothetical protein Tco_0121425 [Tanacetum coccineum]
MCKTRKPLFTIHRFMAIHFPKDLPKIWRAIISCQHNDDGQDDDIGANDDVGLNYDVGPNDDPSLVVSDENQLVEAENLVDAGHNKDQEEAFLMAQASHEVDI